jgi:hypothetical protein
MIYKSASKTQFSMIFSFSMEKKHAKKNRVLPFYICVPNFIAKK